MGVKWLLQWRRNSSDTSAAGLTDEEILNGVAERLNCKAVRDKGGGKIEVKCHLLKQNNPGSQAAASMKDIWLVQSTDAPDSCILVDHKHHSVLQADNGMLSLVEKKLAYRIRTCVTITGKCLSKGDFYVRVASASASMVGQTGGVTFLGHVIEVEYLPLSCPVLAAPLMTEFLELLRAHIPTHPVTGVPVGSLDRSRDTASRFQSLPPTFSPLHTAVLYVDMSLLMLVVKTQIQQQQQQQQQQSQQAGQLAAQPATVSVTSTPA